MRIAQITPGTGDSFYCENCLRDVALVKAMRKKGHDVLMVPMYLPLQDDKDEQSSVVPMFFGGVNVYLQQKFGLFRHTPRWIDRLFDSHRLLGWAGRRGDMTSARDLGEMTLSMLRGEDGRQAKELDRLVEWLGAAENKPDVVCLSNVLLAGPARRIKDELGAGVVCLLQDEDGFLDGLAEPYAEQAWEVVRKRAGDIDKFISVSNYFADVMQARLDIDRTRIEVVYMGVAPNDYEPAESPPAVPTIGFLSRMCASRGLDMLVDAFIALKQKEHLKNARLRVAGGRTSGDEAFVRKLREKLGSQGLAGDAEFLDDFDARAKRDFLRTLSVLSVPEKEAVAGGLYVFEAWASGVGVVEPANGVFPEIVESAGGGVLYEPGDIESLAAALKKVLSDSEYAVELGRRGREAVLRRYNIEQTAEETVRIYEKVCADK